MTALHATFVLQGDWATGEALLARASSAGLFRSYLRACQPRACWRHLHGVDADGVAPSKRGGHAMCINPDRGQIYLIGGWDRHKSLDNFWAYDNIVPSFIGIT